MEREPKYNHVAHVSLAWLSYAFYFITNSVVLSAMTSITSIWGEVLQLPDIPTSMLSLSGMYVILSPLGLALSVFQANVPSRRSAFVVCGAVVIGTVNYIVYVNPFGEPGGYEHMWLRWPVETILAMLVIVILPALSWYETVRRV